MGSDMTAGNHHLHFRTGCSLINHWVSTYGGEAPPRPPGYHYTDEMGVWDFSSERVNLADSTVPSDFEAARDGDFLCKAWNGGPVEKRDFEYAREFLRLAAAAGEGISGSY